MERERRTRIAVVVLGGAAILSMGRAVLSVGPPADRVTDNDTRFREMRALLPPFGVIGYLSDRPEDVAAYYLAQYALAPLVVDRSPSHALVIGRFADAAHARETIARYRLDAVRELGDGLVLLRSRPP